MDLLRGKQTHKYIYFYDEIKPALIILQLFGRFPYRITADGLADFSVFSLPSAYSFFFFAGTASLQFWAQKEVIDEKLVETEVFDVLVFWLLIVLFSVQNFLVPLTYWWDAPAFHIYLRKWRSFQDFAGSEEFELKGTRTVHAVTYTSLVATVGYVLANKCIFPDVSYAMYFLFVPLVGGNLTTLVVWWSSLRELSSISRQLVDRIIMTRSREMLSHRRQVCERLNELTRELGQSMGNSLIALNLVYFSCTVLCLFSSLADISEPRRISYKHAFGLLGAASFLASPIAFLCETGHRATQIIQNDFCQKVLEVDITSKSDFFRNEMRLILQSIIATPPVVEYKGYFPANRRTLTSIAGSAVTYLIVLVQFNGRPSHFTDNVNSTSVSSA